MRPAKAAKQSRAAPQTGLLRFARNDEPFSRRVFAPSSLRGAQATKQSRAAPQTGLLRFARNSVLAARLCARAMPTPLSRHSMIRHHRTLIRWSMRNSSRQTLGGKRLICVTAAWMPGSSPGMTNGKNERERTKEKISEAKRRQTQGRVLPRLAGAAAAPTLTLPRLRGEGMGGGSTSIGVPPRFSSQGVFHRKGLSTRLLLPGTRPLC